MSIRYWLALCLLRGLGYNVVTKAKATPRSVDDRRAGRTVRQRRGRSYVGDDSKTWRDIVAAFASHGPMTRKMLDEHLEVTTSAVHLPRMVERNVLRVQPKSWPYIYELSRSEITDVL